MIPYDLFESKLFNSFEVILKTLLEVVSFEAMMNRLLGDPFREEIPLRYINCFLLFYFVAIAAVVVVVAVVVNFLETIFKSSSCQILFRSFVFKTYLHEHHFSN